jgi:predicted phosphodiesterase
MQGFQFNGPADRASRAKPSSYPHRAELTIDSGTVIIASDAHYWPGEPSLMHRAVVAFCKEYKPKAVIFNGDVIDAPTISRFPSIGWEHRPKLVDEIEAAKERLHEIEKAAFKAEKIWNLGNHDLRLETRLAQVAPEYAGLHGIHLKDHFLLWRPAWSTWINNSVVVKHRFKGGIHAPHNNTLWSGKTIITGHLHSAKVTPFDDYNGTRYGVDGGCIAETDAAAFVNYTEDNPRNWRSSFVCLTFRGGLLMQPELVLKWDEKRVQFRGEVIAP